MTDHQQAEFDMVYSMLRKRKRFAYFLWFFGGAFGFHRLYLGDYKTALILTGVTIFTLGLGSIAGLVDVVNIPRLVAKQNKELELLIVKEVKRVW